MTHRSISSTAIHPSTLLPSLKPVSGGSNLPDELPQLRSLTTDYFSWEQLTIRYPLVFLLQPDYYKVFRVTHPETSIYQENLNLDLGPVEVTNTFICQYTVPCDALHIQRTDKIVMQFAQECQLGSFDFISSMIIRWNGPDNDHRYLLRKTAILQSDKNGLPLYGIMTLKDITPMVSSVKPYNMDITFHPERADLRCELFRRIKAVQPRRQFNLTTRELEIIKCLSLGLSSKEIASMLFISKATVDTHRQNLIHKWEVTNTAALLKLAMMEGWI
jgi:DNA-binding CsgD family transcriptional regulator